MYYKLRQTCVTYWDKLGQTLLQIGAASLLQIAENVVTNLGSYYKLGQPLLQNRAALTNWGRTTSIDLVNIFMLEKENLFWI